LRNEGAKELAYSKELVAINKKLDVLIRVTGLAACKGLPNDEKVWTLYCAGLTLREIGGLLGSNENAAKQAVHRMKKKTGSTRDVD
jgi:DNA-directed RNA polymerase specialized sigma24 family protein